MNFKEILEEFEGRSQEKTSSQKRDNQEWIEAIGAPSEKDLNEKDEGYYQKERPSRRSSSKKDIVEARLDLHGFTREAAERDLIVFIRTSYERGLSLVEVIHGKGRHSKEYAGEYAGEYKNYETSPKPVLKEMVESSRPLLSSWVSEKKSAPKNTGATWFYLRSNQKKKSR